MKKYIKLFRVKHYIKNVLIFLPLVFSKNLLALDRLIPCLFGFLTFSIASSAIYIFNDIMDVEKDRQHPVKKNRPIASGEVSIKQAAVCAVLCLVLSFVLQIFAGRYIYIGFILLYLALNLAYSVALKKKPFWDVIILVSGFFIRVLYGAYIVDVQISAWLYLTIVAISFYMALGKRRNEMKKTESKTRSVLKFYSFDFLDKNMYMCAGIANVFYALWAMDSGNSTHMLLTVPLVLLLSMRYSYDIEKEDSQGDPVDVLLHDKMILCLAAIYAIWVVFALYLIR